jgi:hypothetical protein
LAIFGAFALTLFVVFFAAVFFFAGMFSLLVWALTRE